MELPQEIEAFYTLPAVRRELARRLVQQGFTQRLIAKKLDVTEAAVSQYLSNKRGITIDFPAEVTFELEAAAKRIITIDAVAVRKEIIRLSDLMKQHKVICTLHKKHGGAKEGCATCYE